MPTEPIRLTTRQAEIVTMLAKGFLQKTAAYELGISERTMHAHIRHIMKRTGCATITEVCVKAALQGVIKV